MRTYTAPIIALLIISLLGLSGCQVVSYELVSLPTDATYTDTLSSQLRVHTLDGEVIIFPADVQITSEYIYGGGLLYGLAPSQHPDRYVDAYPRDSVAYMSTDNRKKDVTASSAYTFAAMLGIIGTVFVLVVLAGVSGSCLYGSCS